MAEEERIVMPPSPAGFALASRAVGPQVGKKTGVTVLVETPEKHPCNALFDADEGDVATPTTHSKEPDAGTGGMFDFDDLPSSDDDLNAKPPCISAKAVEIKDEVVPISFVAEKILKARDAVVIGDEKAKEVETVADKGKPAAPAEVHDQHFAKRPGVPDFAGKPVDLAMLINGSRGDVQPLVALAQQLGQQGRRVVIFTNHDFIEFCESAGVEAVCTFASWSALFAELGGLHCPEVEETKPIATQDVLEYMQESINNQRAHEAARAWRQKYPGVVQDPYEALVRYQPSAVLHCVQSQMPAARYELQHRVPAIPVYFTSAFGAHFTIERPPRPSLFAVSPMLDVRGKASPHEHITGAWVLEEDIQSSDICPRGSLHCLQNFLNAGDKPVAIGWGSMVPQNCSPYAMLALALRALKLVGKRGVVIGGWAKLDMLGDDFLRGQLPNLGGVEHEALKSFARHNVFFSPSVPHDWLLPQCCCAVHHGGSGTTQAALRYACPSVVTPMFGDQFHFAQRIQKLGAGFGFQKSLWNVSPEDLAKAINKAVRMAPKALSKRMQAEQGTVVVASVLDTFLDNEVRSGNFARGFDKVREDEKGKP